MQAIEPGIVSLGQPPARLAAYATWAGGFYHMFERDIEWEI